MRASSILVASLLAANVAAQNTASHVIMSDTTSTVQVMPATAGTTQVFAVEPLKPEETARLNALRAAYDKAERELRSAETDIKQSHGQSRPSFVTTASCIQGNTSVELRGDYALITHTTYNVCALPSE